ncbi:hypothetical protein VTK26DRAFT_6659 [Humicola hyalothermophila]
MYWASEVIERVQTFAVVITVEWIDRTADWKGAACCCDLGRVSLEKARRVENTAAESNTNYVTGESRKGPVERGIRAGDRPSQKVYRVMCVEYGTELGEGFFLGLTGGLLKGQLVRFHRSDIVIMLINLACQYISRQLMTPDVALRCGRLFGEICTQ